MNWTEGGIKRKPLNFHFNLLFVAWRRWFSKGVASEGKGDVSTVEKFSRERRRFDKDRRKD